MIGQNKTLALCSYCETYAFVEVSLKIHNQKLRDSTGFFWSTWVSQIYLPDGPHIFQDAHVF